MAAPPLKMPGGGNGKEQLRSSCLVSSRASCSRRVTYVVEKGKPLASLAPEQGGFGVIAWPPGA
jgi:hypothetical protein